MKLTFQKYVPITKVDDEERMVFGWASTPDIDSDGEIIKSEALEKALPEYMKFPTIREMHQPKVAGTTKQADVSKKGLYIGAKILAQEAWDLIKGGGYAGFSIGGNVLKRVGNVIHELELVEISLVDVPANKAATIELWKKEKISKDAETVYSMANLMIQVKDKISYYRYLGKDVKKLEKILEMLKQIIAVEATEAEPEPSEDGPMEGYFGGATPEQYKQKIQLLEAMDFTNNPMADSLRKGVIIGMKAKANELKKEDDPKKPAEGAEETPNGDAEAKDEGKAEEGKTEVTADADEAKAEDTAEEEKEAGETATTLTKLAAIEAKLEKMTPKAEAKADPSIAKAVSSIAGSLAKVVDTLMGMEGRIAKLESTPAATKAKSAVVLKSIEGGSEDSPKKDAEKPTAELAVKKARWVELDALFEKLGANEFAKQGFSKEAMALQNEIAALERAK